MPATPLAPRTPNGRRARRLRHAVVALSNVRVSEDTYGDICVAANKRGLTNAAYVRMVLLAEMERERRNGALPTSPMPPGANGTPAGLAAR